MRHEERNQNPSNTSDSAPLTKTSSPVAPTCEEKEKIEEKLDEAIMETFPASDPISISTPPSCSYPAPLTN
jgi:hypothetical protein